MTYDTAGRQNNCTSILVALVITGWYKLYTLYGDKEPNGIFTQERNAASLKCLVCLYTGCPIRITLGSSEYKTCKVNHSSTNSMKPYKEHKVKNILCSSYSMQLIKLQKPNL